MIEHPGDAIVGVTRDCICGSDLHLYRGLVPDTRIGHTFVHEFAGIVEENVHNTNSEATAMGGIQGESHTTGGYDGGQAKYVRVPMAAVGPYRSPRTSRTTTRCC